MPKNSFENHMHIPLNRKKLQLELNIIFTTSVYIPKHFARFTISQKNILFGKFLNLSLTFGLPLGERSITPKTPKLGDKSCLEFLGKVKEVINRKNHVGLPPKGR